MPDAIAGGGKMKEETAIMVNWVFNGIDCCCVGFLSHAFVVQGSIWDGICARWWRCSEKTIPPSFAMPSGIKIRGLHKLLSSARRKCHSALAISLGRRTRE